MLARRTLSNSLCRIWLASTTRNLSSSRPAPVETDDLGIPKSPTWSVHQLISSYPRPHVSPELLAKLHSLSALIPPAEGSPEHAKLTREIEEMIRLVEAVKLVDVSTLETQDGEPVPDGRIWPDNTGMTLSTNTRDVEYEPDDGATGRELLKHAARVKDGFYVVDTDRRKR